jgi:transcriptional regulator with PAS, ATPase and Fis domain
MMEKAASTNISVSIVGETGTGKELVAKSIHQSSARRNGPFVAVNMSAIPRELLESELFGYEKGAFTGAMARKKGQFEQADGGTLFLDEIGEMDMGMQAKLLRALQEREVMRVGGDSPVAFDARLITATNRSLADEVQRGNFREDLYYRLLGLNIVMPPLRERSNDILLLGQHFLDGFAKANGLGKLELAREAKEKLMAYAFPGNVRELRALMELAAVMASDGMVHAGDIRFNSVRRETAFLSEQLTLEEYKTRIINHFLEKYNNDVLLVAKKLDIGKSTIYRMLADSGGRQQRSFSAAY